MVLQISFGLDHHMTYGIACAGRTPSVWGSTIVGRAILTL